MIRKKGTYEVDVRENMRGGMGAVRIEHFWKKDELETNVRLCARLILEPGCSIGFHEHVGEEEVFIVAKGRGRVMDGDESVVVEEGDTILTGNGAGHAVEALGDTPLELIAVIVRGEST